MTSFEFYTVLLSFVVSLGVASLLRAVTRLFQDWPRVRFSLAWALWAAAIFNIQVVYWLRSWTYHEQFTLRIETSIPPLVLAILAFTCCGLATPNIAEAGAIDLRDFHAKQGRKYQVAYAVFMVMAIVQGILMSNVGGDSSTTIVSDAVTQSIIAAVAIACAVFPHLRWLQIGAPALFLASAVFYYGRLMEQ
jgi:hypothetical protein